MRDTPATRSKHVPTALYWRTRLFAATRGAWKRLGGIESGVLREEIERTPIQQPIYIAGVPRSGSTVLTELLASHPQVTSHRYSDFPNVYTPYWRNWLARHGARSKARPVERAHRDRILVTRESPEAVEEVLWRAYFDAVRPPDGDQLLDSETRHPTFERFYRDHLRKLLRIRQRSRYLAKGNYNLTRMRYLQALFPDARFIVPIRNPVDQVASLVKQDRLFDRLAEEDPRVVRQLHSSGHYEFGPGRRAVILDAEPETRKIEALWKAGRRVEGWALYWATLYRHLHDQLTAHPDLADATRIVRYEEFCSSPRKVVLDTLAHVGLAPEDFGPDLEHALDSISAPDYYQPHFLDEERSILKRITEPVAARFGYPASA